MKIIVGLGNPGLEYERTRHNAGWMAAGRLAELAAARPVRYGGPGALARAGEMWLFRPLAYMNCSGPPVARLLREKEAALGDLLVMVDDMALPLGRVRLRPSGSSGGHNGLESLAGALGTEAFARLRMGIGACPAGMDGRDYVLSPFEPHEWEAVEEMADRAAEAALCWAHEGIEEAMTRFNRKAEEAPGVDSPPACTGKGTPQGRRDCFGDEPV